MEFHDWTNQALESFSQDGRVKPELRAFAQWELAYREAFDIYVDFHPVSGTIRHRTLITDRDFEAALKDDQALTPAPIDRSRYTLAETKKRIRRQRIRAEMAAKF